MIDYRRFTGEFASASAIAAVLAFQFAKCGELPGGFFGSKPVRLNGKGILLIGLGEFITAIEIIP